MCSVSEEDLCDEFSIFGVELTDRNIVDKLIELCAVHRLDASEIVTEWVAFAHTKKNVSLTPDILEPFERERLSKRALKPSKGQHTKKNTAPVIYDINTIQGGIDEDAAEQLYNAYSGGTPTATPSNKGSGSQKRQHTPDNVPLKRFTGPNRSPVIPFSPASFSPSSATPSKKYSSRSNAGEVLFTYGAVDNIKWTGQSQGCSITLFDEVSGLKKQFKYMFQKLTEKAHVLNDMIEDMGSQLQKHHDEIDELSHVTLPTQEPVTVVGRVCCDSQGKLNAKSVLLEGSRETSAGKCIPVDLSELPQFSLFPGQIVALDGINTTGQKFVAKKIHEGVCLPLPDIKVNNEAGSALSVVVAAGPFSTSDNVCYEPLADLIKYLQRDKPDVCILMGPFVDVKNEEIDKGNINMTYDHLFKLHMDQLGKATENLSCQIIVIPSPRDVHHDCVYPQPPFQLDKFQHKHIQFMSDPCTLTINNVVFGITATDILFHIGAEEISFPPGSTDRLGRLTQHLLTQHSYYPLCPPSDEVSIDFEKFEQHAFLPVTPHILVIASDLRYFVKDLKGCVCVNPGRLAKGQVGGTYVRLVVQPNKQSNRPQVQDIAAQVLRV